MKQLWNSLIAGHLLGLMTLGACYFASNFLLPADSGITLTFTVVVSFSAFIIGFGLSFFLFPKNSKG